MFKPPKNMKWTDWAQEYAAVLGSFTSFIIMVALLAAFDGKVVATWNGVTLNAVVSILSLIMKASLAYVLAECLAQWKWVLFAREARPLIDFDRIDAATRGPLGSLRVLARTKGPISLWLGAVVTLLAIGIDPFTQQLIQFRSGLVSEPSHAARIARSSGYTVGTVSTMTERMPLSMKTAVLTGLTRSPAELAQQVLVQCPTSNCTWPPFRTLGVCHRCTNVTASLRRVGGIGGFLVNISNNIVGIDGPVMFDDSGTFPSTAYTLPNGHFIANVNGCPPYSGLDSNLSCTGEGNFSNIIYHNYKYAMTSFGTGNQSKTLTMKGLDTLIWSTSFIHPSLDAVTTAFMRPYPLIWPDVPLQATECALYYCVKGVDSRMEGNQLHENITELSSKREAAFDDTSRPAYSPVSNFTDKGRGYAADLYLTSPNSSDPAFFVNGGSVIAISAYIQSLFIANYTDPLGGQGPFAELFTAQDLVDPSSPRMHQEIDTSLGISGAMGINGASFGPGGKTNLAMIALPPALDKLWTWTNPNVVSTFESLATSITNEMRRNDRTDGVGGQDDTIALYGKVSHWTTVYQIQWAWGALHALVLVLGIVFIVVTVGGEGPLWKGSTLATMRRGWEVGGVEGETVEEMEGGAKGRWVGGGEEGACLQKRPVDERGRNSESVEGGEEDMEPTIPVGDH
ncbi:hypothetical protein VF21_07999 [Pseudogymnoascus sp. 05NY08]|nr:hypothetical protein VF21_07999 [Pseudogymnoascus sp. 05NY08]